MMMFRQNAFRRLTQHSRIGSNLMIHCNGSSIIRGSNSNSTFHASYLSTAVNANVNGSAEEDAYLRADVKTMGSILGKVISLKTHTATSSKSDSLELFDSVEELRSLAKDWRNCVEDEKDRSVKFQKMAEFCSQLSNEQLQHVARAFTHFLALANTAEAHHRTRKNLAYLRQKEQEQQAGALPMALMDKRDSCGGVIPNLLSTGACTKDEIYEALCTQQVELVLTAHPTEVNKRTTLQKNKRVLELLSQVDEQRLNGTVASSYASNRLFHDLENQISSLWQSDEVARAKPSPQIEARRGMLVLESVLWEALPEFLEKLSHTMERELGKEYALPLTACPIKFSSWMGGDRDGNPNGMCLVMERYCGKILCLILLLCFCQLPLMLLEKLCGEIVCNVRILSFQKSENLPMRLLC